MGKCTSDCLKTERERKKNYADLEERDLKLSLNAEIMLRSVTRPFLIYFS